MKLSDRDKLIFEKILTKIELLEAIAKDKSMEEFLQDEILQHASAMAFLNIGELANKLSKEITENAKEIPIHKMRGMRNVAAHEYDALRFDKIWLTIEKDLPSLKQAIAKLIGE